MMVHCASTSTIFSRVSYIVVGVQNYTAPNQLTAAFVKIRGFVHVSGSVTIGIIEAEKSAE